MTYWHLERTKKLLTTCTCTCTFVSFVLNVIAVAYSGLKQSLIIFGKNEVIIRKLFETCEATVILSIKSEMKLMPMGENCENLCLWGRFHVEFEK